MWLIQLVEHGPVFKGKEHVIPAVTYLTIRDIVVNGDKPVRNGQMCMILLKRMTDHLRRLWERVLWVQSFSLGREKF